MWFLDLIISAIGSIIGWLYDAAQYCYDSWYVPNQLGDVFIYIMGQLVHIGFQLIEWNEWIDSVAGEIKLIPTWDTIQSWFGSYFEMAKDAWDWVSNAVTNVWDSISDWWSGTWVNVQSWVNSAIDIGGDVIDSIYGWVNEAKSAILDLIDKVPSINEITSWFSNWWGNILGRIQSLGYLPAGAIGDFINSTLSDWFPFYATLSEWWGSVLEFITNPLDWLMDRIEYWFFDRRS